MRDIPFSVILAFPPASYDSPTTRGSALMVVNSVFLVLVTIFVALRMYTRIFIVRTFGWDDASLLVGYALAVALAADVMLANNNFYWDRHIWDIPLAAVPALGKSAMAAKVLFLAAAAFIRFALLLFYFRLVSDTNLREFKWALHGTVYFNFSTFVIFTFLAIFQCTPISAYWQLGKSHQCIDEGKSSLAVGIISCFADLLVTALPIPIILKLQMPVSQRVGVAFLLSLGFIVTIAGVIRTYFIWKALISSYDETWFAYPLWISAAVEIQLSVITACIPSLRPLFALYFPGLSNPVIALTDKFMSGSSGSKGSGPGNPANRSKSLSALDANVTTETGSYQSVDIEQLRTTKRASAFSTQRSLKKLNWQIMRQQSIEVRRSALSSSIGNDQIKSSDTWPKSPNMGSTTTERDKPKRFGSFFTSWCKRSSSNGTSSVGVTPDNATIVGPEFAVPLCPLHDAHTTQAYYTPTHDSSKSTQISKYTSTEISQTENWWPRKGPEVEIDDDHEKQTSDDSYHRVEIERNQCNGTAENHEDTIENSSISGRHSDDRRVQSTATMLTAQFASHSSLSDGLSLSDHCNLWL